MKKILAGFLTLFLTLDSVAKKNTKPIALSQTWHIEQCPKDTICSLEKTDVSWTYAQDEITNCNLRNVDKNIYNYPISIELKNNNNFYVHVTIDRFNVSSAYAGVKIDGGGELSTKYLLAPQETKQLKYTEKCFAAIKDGTLLASAPSYASSKITITQ